MQITAMEKYVRRSRSSTSLQRRAAEKKKGFLAKTLERCWSLGGGRRRPRWPTTTPPGCFVVLVGPERERFAVRADGANHPLFRALLDEAEAEYGFPRPAAEPLLLPCAADEFLRVMSEAGFSFSAKFRRNFRNFTFFSEVRKKFYIGQIFRLNSYFASKLLQTTIK